MVQESPDLRGVISGSRLWIPVGLMHMALSKLDILLVLVAAYGPFAAMAYWGLPEAPTPFYVPIPGNSS